MWQRIQDLDRRILYVFFTLALMIPLFHPFGLPIVVGDQVQRFYDRFNKLPPGSVLWFSADYSPGAAAELDPQFKVVLRHAFRNGHRVLVYGMFELGAPLAQDIAEEVSREMGKKHGVDWVFLGWRPGGEVVIRRATEDLWGAMEQRDGYGKPLTDHPLMAAVPRLWTPYIDAIICFSSGSPGDPEYMRVVTDPSLAEPEPVLLFTGQVMVQVTARIPFIRSEQIQGMIPGMGGAAEYEVLSGFPGAAVGLMDAQSMAHIILFGFIVLGNVAYFRVRAGRK